MPRHALPVVTSTQSAFWTAVRLVGESGRLDGYGRMLALWPKLTSVPR